jgi:hypothetical protein
LAGKLTGERSVGGAKRKPPPALPGEMQAFFLEKEPKTGAGFL